MKHFIQWLHPRKQGKDRTVCCKKPSEWASVPAQKPGTLETSPVCTSSGDTEKQEDRPAGSLVLNKNLGLRMGLLRGKEVAEGAPGLGKTHEWVTQGLVHPTTSADMCSVNIQN